MSYFSLIQNAFLMRPKRLAIIEACLIGFICGLAGVALKLGVGWLGGWRIQTSLLFPAWLVLPACGMVGGFLTGLLVERVAPEAAGSGIPQVKASLAGAKMPLNFRIAAVKLLATVVTVGSGLTLGRQGPTVQIGASLAAFISNWVPTSPEYRRQLIACGAAAGLAAGFNAPIAGVLFVVEELLQDVSGLTLGPAIIASFIGAVVSQLLGGESLNLALKEHLTSFSPREIPFYLLLGICSGMMGALFTSSILQVIQFNRRYLKIGLPLRIALAGFICGLCVAFLPTFFRNNTGLREILASGETSFFISLVAFCAHFILTIIAAGSGAPGGLFAPSLVLGAALGHLIGIIEVDLLGIGFATTYALAGMGAFFCAVCRAPVTAVVIVFEITTDFGLVLPLMIASVVAYLVAEKLEKGSLYERLNEFNGIQIPKGTSTDDVFKNLKAIDVMQPKVETLSAEMKLDDAMLAFSRSHHRGFPILEDGKLVGILTQTDLANASKQELAGDTLLREIMSPQPITISPQDSLSEVLFRLNQYNLSRLPVTDGRRLVGIITRTDIIRIESDKLTNKDTQTGPVAQPSYMVYASRSPATGKGRLLVTISNPQTAETLLELACAVAKEKNFELECLQIISVSRRRAPAEMPVRTTKSRRLLELAERVAQQKKVPVHTQIRVAHDKAQAILETIKDRHIDLIFMGWKGNTKNPGHIFGATVDTVIRQAPCDVILIKTHGQLSCLNRWLVPMAGGPNAQRAIELLPALIAISPKPEIKLCQVCDSTDKEPDNTVLEKAAKILNRHLSIPITLIPVCAPSVVEALIDLVEKAQCDVVVLGTSREGMLKQVIKGNIPEQIAQGCDCTVILVRSQ